MAHIVQCRICRQKFDTELLSKDEWVRPTKTQYYHTKCYQDWKNARNNIVTNGRNEVFWYETLIDYLYRDVKLSMDFSKIASQWDNFTKTKYTPKGIYFSIRYFYEVLHGDKEKALGGIGIVPSIYREASEYWVNLEQKRAGTMDAIIQQIKERELRPIALTAPKPKTIRNKTRFDLDNI